MSDEQKKPDPKVVIASFNQLVRNERNRRRVQIGPATSRDSLNDALRAAAGHDPQHTEEESGTHPWRSLTSRDGDT